MLITDSRYSKKRIFAKNSTAVEHMIPYYVGIVFMKKTLTADGWKMIF